MSGRNASLGSPIRVLTSYVFSLRRNETKKACYRDYAKAPAPYINHLVNAQYREPLSHIIVFLARKIGPGLPVRLGRVETTGRTPKMRGASTKPGIPVRDGFAEAIPRRAFRDGRCYL